MLSTLPVSAGTVAVSSVASDVAAASSEMTRNNILLQAGTSTLAQANQVNQLALKLIG